MTVSLHPADRQKNSVEEGMRIRRTARDVHVHRNNLIYTSPRGVVSAENAAAATTRADGHDEPRRGHCVVSVLQRRFHIARNRAGNQKHVGMTWRRHEMNAEAFDVV